MRILQVHNRYRDPGGEDRVVDDEHELLRGVGHSVEQYLVTNPTGRAPAVGSLAAAVWNPLRAREMSAIVRSFRPDVAHVHNTWFSLSPSVLSSLKSEGVPVVMTLHNFRLMCANGLLFRSGAICEECLQYSRLRAVVHRCYRGSQLLSGLTALNFAVHAWADTWERKVDRFIVMSEVAREKFIEGGLNPDKVVVRENWAQDPGERQEVPGQSNVVLFVGRLSTEKGIELLVDSWRDAGLVDFELVVVGDGPMRVDLQKKHEKNVRFVGFKDPNWVGKAMQSARCLVFPSLWYEVGTPRVPIEAIASGLPVVISDSVSMAQLIDGTEAGWSFESGEPGSLVKSLRSIQSSDLVNAAGRSARTLFLTRFGPDRARQSLESTYLAAIADRGVR